MTKISMIGSIPAVPSDEWQDRGKEVPSKPFIDYMDLTSGQMSLILLKEQMDILGGYYPEARKELLPAIQKIDQALYQGVHNVGYLQSGISNAERLVNQVIAKAKNNLRPAGGFFVPKGLQGIGVEVEEFDNGGGGGYAAPGASTTPLPPDVQADLSKYAQLPNCQKIVDQLRRTSGLFDNKKKQALRAELEECYHREKLVKVLNDKLEQSGHHMLYNYASASVAAPYSAVTTKRILHANAVSGFANISKIERKNLEMWLSNGIMRSNATAGAPPLQPEQTIIGMRDYVKANAGIGEPLTIAAITAIITAIASAAGAVLAILAQLRAAELARLEGQAQAIQSPLFGPDQDDFLTGKDAAGIPGWILPAGLAVGAGLLLFGGKD